MQETLDYPVKPIECWQRMKELRRAHFRHTWEAQSKGEVAVLGVVEAFLGLLAGMGDFANPTYGPYYTRLMRDPERLIKALEVVEAHGYGHEMCSSMRTHLGQILSGMATLDPQGKPFRPDFIFQFYMCHSVSKMAQTAAEHLGVPHFILMVPHQDSPSHRAYVTGQMVEAIEWMEKVTGRKFDDEKFAEATRNEWECMVLWAKICELQKNVPAPLDIRLMWSLRLPIVVSRHKKEAVDFYRDLLAEVQQRIRDGISARGFEKARLLLEGFIPFYDMAVLRWPEEYRCIYVGGQGPFTTFAAWDVAEDGTWTVPQTWMERGMPLKTREDVLNAQADLYCGHFPMFTNYLLARRPPQFGKMAADWKADGVVVGFDRGCRGLGAGMREAVRALHRAHVPVGVFEGSMCDPRDFDKVRAREELTPFFEALGLKKYEVIADYAEEEEGPIGHMG